MPEKIKKDWEEFDISGIPSSYKLMVESLQQLNKFSAWMITIGIATLGFFITILFQIKQEPALPNKYFAMIAMISLIVSIGFGFYLISLRQETSFFNCQIFSGTFRHNSKCC